MKVHLPACIRNCSSLQNTTCRAALYSRCPLWARLWSILSDRPRMRHLGFPSKNIRMMTRMSIFRCSVKIRDSFRRRSIRLSRLCKRLEMASRGHRARRGLGGLWVSNRGIARFRGASKSLVSSSSRHSKSVETQWSCKSKATTLPWAQSNHHSSAMTHPSSQEISISTRQNLNCTTESVQLKHLKLTKQTKIFRQ